MNREEADKELKEIQDNLNKLEAQRLLLIKEEYRLCMRRHVLMAEFYPEVLQEQIDKVMALRRKNRGDNHGSI